MRTKGWGGSFFGGRLKTTTSPSTSAVCCLLGAGISTVFLLAASTAPGLVLPLPGPDPFIAEFFRLSAAFPTPVDATVGDGLGRWGVLGSCTEFDLLSGRGGCFAPVGPCNRGAGLGPNFMRCDMAGEAWVAICRGDTETGNECVGRSDFLGEADGDCQR